MARVGPASGSLTPAAHAPPAHGSLACRATRRLTQVYFVSVVGIVCLLWGAGDQWWPATLFLFGPRWPILVPLLLLIPLALLFRRRSLLGQFAALVLAAGPYMGLSLPWERVADYFAPPPDLTLRLVTYNCGGATDEAVVRMVQTVQPDLLTLNEWHGSRALPEALTAGRHVSRAGGNVVISRLPIEAAEGLQSEALKPWEQRAMRCRLRTAVGPIQIVCLHLETPRKGLSEVVDSRWRGLEALRQNTAKRRAESLLVSRFASEFSGPAIVAGDFNTPVESRIYQSQWAGWQNAFSRAGCGLGHTKYTRLYGIRIDHVLVSSHWRVISARVGPDLGGDHRPVVAELALRL